MGDPDAATPKQEQSLSSLFDEVRNTVEMEAQIIAAVFPNPTFVLQTFLQRIFAQSVQGHLELLMERANNVDFSRGLPEGEVVMHSSHADLSFLRTLQLARTCTIGLVNDLKAYDTAAGTSEARAVLGRASTEPQSAGASVGVSTSLSHMLDNTLEELFVPYMEGALYIDREIRNLIDLYTTHLAKFTAVHVSAFNFV
jgi:exocyst complex component 5